MLNIVAGILFPILLGLAWLPWLTTGFRRSLAAPLAVLFGAMTAALAGWGGSAVKLDMWPMAVITLLLTLAAGLGLRLRFPLSAPTAPQLEGGPEALPFRLATWGFAAALSAVGIIYLWANALHPPVLAGSIFHWSGPARGLGAIFGFPLRLSATYYQFSASDLGWKYLWSVLNLLPWLAIFAALREQGKTRAAAAAAALVPMLSFSLLFWASAGYPDLFLSGCVILLWLFAFSTEEKQRLFLLAPALVIAWAGPFWGALAGIGLLCAAVVEREKPFRGLWTVVALFFLLRWAASSTPDWARAKDVALYLGRDAWNTARYGALFYLIVAIILRRGALHRESAMVLLAIAATLLVTIVDISGRSEKILDVLLHVDGNRAFACALLIAWPLALRLWPTRMNG